MWITTIATLLALTAGFTLAWAAPPSTWTNQWSLEERQGRIIMKVARTPCELGLMLYRDGQITAVCLKSNPPDR